MATRTPWNPTAITGEIVDQSDIRSIPGGWVGYAEIESDVSSITAEQDVSGLSVSVTLTSGRRYLCEAYVNTSSGSHDSFRNIELYDASTRLQISRYDVDTANNVIAHNPRCIIDGDGSSHTIKVRASWAGTGSMAVKADSEFPAFVLVQDVGPSS